MTTRLARQTRKGFISTDKFKDVFQIHVTISFEHLHPRVSKNNTIMVLNIFNMDSGHRLGLTGHFKPSKTFSSKSSKVDGSIDAKNTMSESECGCACACVCLWACERVRIIVKCLKCSERITFCFYYGLTNNQSLKSVTQLGILIPVVFVRSILVACSLQEDPIGSFLPLY